MHSKAQTKPVHCRHDALLTSVSHKAANCCRVAAGCVDVVVVVVEQCCCAQQQQQHAFAVSVMPAWRTACVKGIYGVNNIQKTAQTQRCTLERALIDARACAHVLHICSTRRGMCWCHSITSFVVAKSFVICANVTRKPHSTTVTTTWLAMFSPVISAYNAHFAFRTQSFCKAHARTRGLDSKVVSWI